MIFTVDLPLCPSANNAFVNVPKRGRVPSADHVAWKNTARRIVRDAWIAQGQPAITKPYAVYIAVNVNYRSDVANREKLCVDLIVATTDIPGDQWIDRIVIERDRSVEGMRVEVMSLPTMVAL